jgi:hypothetical protein
MLAFSAYEMKTSIHKLKVNQATRKTGGCNIRYDSRILVSAIVCPALLFIALEYVKEA